MHHTTTQDIDPRCAVWKQPTDGNKQTNKHDPTPRISRAICAVAWSVSRLTSGAETYQLASSTRWQKKRHSKTCGGTSGDFNRRAWRGVIRVVTVSFAKEKWGTTRRFSALNSWRGSKCRRKRRSGGKGHPVGCCRHSSRDVNEGRKNIM